MILIVSRPNPSALFALSVFIVICLSLAYAGLSGYLSKGGWTWYYSIAVYFFGPLAVMLSIRILLKFKVIYLDKGKFRVWFPFRFVRKAWNINEIEYWKEEKVKTGRTTFREMEIAFPGGKLKISHQENTSYDKIFNYLNKKAGKKRND